MTQQNNPTHAEPDEELEEILFKVWNDGKSEPYEIREGLHRNTIEEAKTELLAYFTARERQILQKLLDNGHGGGNWRRLIIQELDTLGLQEETHE